jgi:ribosomal biogenesis protein LAS1
MIRSNPSTPTRFLSMRVTQSLSWLLQNYFLPTLHPGVLAPTAAGAAASSPSTMTRPVGPLLRRYKSLLKTVSRDASLRAWHGADISGALREIERWLAEARVAAHTHASEFASWLPYRDCGRAAVQMDDGERDDEGDEDEDEVLEPTEAWALDRFCDALLEKGALVPISRKSVYRHSYPPPPPSSNKSQPKKSIRSGPAD